MVGSVFQSQINRLLCVVTRVGCRQEGRRVVDVVDVFVVVFVVTFGY